MIVSRSRDQSPLFGPGAKNCCEILNELITLEKASETDGAETFRRTRRTVRR